MNFIIPQYIYLAAPRPITANKETQADQVHPTEHRITQTIGLRKPVVLNSCFEIYVNEINANYPWLQCGLLSLDKNNAIQALDVSRMQSDLHPKHGGPASLAHVILTEQGLVKFSIASKECMSEDVDINSGDISVFTSYLDKLNNSYVFCNGINVDEYRSVCTNIRYSSKSVTRTDYPFERYHASKCLKWYELRRNATSEEHAFVADGSNRCKKCSQAYRYLRHKQREEIIKIGSPRKRRIEVSSHFPISYLSPASKKRRITNVRQARRNSDAKLARLTKTLEQYTITLHPEQSTELHEFVSNHITEEKLNEALGERGKDGGSTTQALKEAFFKDQQRNKQHSRGNRWSMATYRIALSIYCRSPAAYESLRSWKIFNLPTKFSLKQFTTALLHDSGPYFDFIKDQAIKYASYKKECVQSNCKEPIGEGVLILDEVKVVGKVAWNSKNGKLCGIAMDYHHCSFVADIYEDLDNADRAPVAAEYFLQFLWRDMSSDFDVIGPHYATATTMDSNFTHACMMDALEAFQAYNFKVVALVMDGASTNLSMIKLLSGHGKGAYGIDSSQEDPHRVWPSFPNPHYGDKIHMIICPTHQLKNLINQLWASKDSGKKSFRRPQENISFGWKAVQGMWEREKERRDNHQVRIVPGLVQSYIERDAWTKLNVKPAKIMQQDAVLAELYSYANPDHTEHPTDEKEVMATYNYLKAVEALFEKGLLDSNRFTSRVEHLNSPVIENLNKGFQYFKDWMDACIKEYKLALYCLTNMNTNISSLRY